MMKRQPAVAGSFYPAGEAALQNVVEQLSSSEATTSKAYGLMAPHAGYVYSGSIAMETYAEVDIPKTVILLGPDHVGRAGIASVFAEGGWLTPLGEVPINAPLAQSILHQSPLFCDDPQAHQREHSLEVHLPLLQTLQPELTIVPIMFGRGTLANWIDCGRALHRCIEEWADPVLVVASSDMSHFLTADQAEKVDHQALAPLLELEPEKLYQTVTENRISMCGVVPATVLLAAACAQGDLKARLIRYGHSGEVSGDNERVVGYAGVVIA